MDDKYRGDYQVVRVLMGSLAVEHQVVMISHLDSTRPVGEYWMNVSLCDENHEVTNSGPLIDPICLL